MSLSVDVQVGVSIDLCELFFLHVYIAQGGMASRGVFFLFPSVKSTAFLTCLSTILFYLLFGQ